MVFNSVAALIKFLGVLGNIGYLVPFYDYNAELIKNGFTKHIHFYKVDIELDTNSNITLVFNDKGNQYKIFLMKGLV